MCLHTVFSIAMAQREYREDFVNGAPRVPDFQGNVVRVQEIFKEFIARGGFDCFKLLGG